MTFNPGWDESANALADFDDVRAIQKDFKRKRGRDNQRNGSGSGSMVFSDPDGNVILIDQHI